MPADGGRSYLLPLLCIGINHHHRRPKNFGWVDFQHLPRFFPYRRLSDCFITPVYINASCASCIFSYVSANTWYARVCIIRWGESRESPQYGASFRRNFPFSVICIQRQFSDLIASVDATASVNRTVNNIYIPLTANGHRFSRRCPANVSLTHSSRLPP